MALPKLTGSISLDARSRRKLNDLIKFSATFGFSVDKVMDSNARNTLAKMKKDAPVDTGRLRRNITAQYAIDNKVDFSSEAIDPETKEDYAPKQEFGTRFLPAQPYFYKNINAFKRRFEADVRSIFRNLSGIGSRFRR